jgi:hypothetical protein
MALVNQGGALRLVGGALGTGQACCCGDGRCCVTVTQVRCCHTVTVPAGEFNEEYSYPQTLNLQYINAEEQAAVEATCDALGGTLYMYSQGKSCLTIPAATCTASGGEPCSETCPPPPQELCPIAPPFDFIVGECGRCTYQDALAGITFILSLTPEQVNSGYNCPSPWSLFVQGPFEDFGGGTCEAEWNYYVYCVDCVGSIPICDAECNPIYNERFIPLYVAPDAELEPGQQPCDGCNPLP